MHLTRYANIQWLDWPAHAKVKACYSMRMNGESLPPFASFNLGDHVGDDPEHVSRNRQNLSDMIQQPNIHWLKQVHSTEVLSITTAPDPFQECVADASMTRQYRHVCCVMTADCLPVFFCDEQGQQVAVAHAGWRGLLEGVLQSTVATFSRPVTVLAYLGPAISQAAFEVGEEVREAFIEKNSLFSQCFVPSSTSHDKWMADLYAIARIILHAQGVSRIYGGNHCTYSESDLFFSYRRDGVTGRMANLIWLEPH